MQLPSRTSFAYLKPTVSGVVGFMIIAFAPSRSPFSTRITNSFTVRSGHVTHHQPAAASDEATLRVSMVQSSQRGSFILCGRIGNGIDTSRGLRLHCKEAHWFGQCLPFRSPR